MTRKPRLNPEKAESLCAPGVGVTCFYCCPPIRPEGYDPWLEADRLRAVVARNTAAFGENLAKGAEIPGNHCWALGYLGPDETQVGCLLHPMQNGGRDLRGVTGYGAKCTRERCREAEVFDGLSPAEREHCLELAETTNAFAFSSRQRNPLMRLLTCGKTVTRAVLQRETQSGGALSPETFRTRYAVLFDPLSPDRDGYWVARLAEAGRFDLLSPEGVDRLVSIRDRTGHALRQAMGPRPADRPEGGRMVHGFDLPLSLSRWLKFGAGVWRARADEIDRIRAEVERAVGELLAGPVR